MAFTRTELLVVMICLSLLALVTAPFVLRKRLVGQMQQVMHNGRTIYMANLPNDYVEWTDKGESYEKWVEMAFPSERLGKAYGTSTRYFGWTASSWTRPYFNLFSAPGLRTYTGTNAADFTADNNAWCVVLDTSRPLTNNSQPFYFTRNLAIAQMSDRAASLSDEVPFGRHGMVVIMSDGSGLTLNEAGILGVFNGSFSNSVLRP